MQPAELNDSRVALSAGDTARDGVLSRALRLERLARAIEGLTVKAAEFHGNQWVDAHGNPVQQHAGWIDDPSRPDRQEPPDLLDTKARLSSGQHIVEVHHERLHLTDVDALQGKRGTKTFHGPTGVYSGSSVGRALEQYYKSEQYQRDNQQPMVSDRVYKVGSAFYRNYSKGTLARVNPKEGWLGEHWARLQASSPKAACPNTHDGQHVWETLEDGRALCFECDAVKASELGQVHNPEGHNQWTRVGVEHVKVGDIVDTGQDGEKTVSEISVVTDPAPGIAFQKGWLKHHFKEGGWVTSRPGRSLAVKRKVVQASDATAVGHRFWGNQWTNQALHPEGDPQGEPSGKIKTAVLVIGGKRYRGPSHFQALGEYMDEVFDAAKSRGEALPTSVPYKVQHEGFETESGHFLNRHQAAVYVDSKRPAFHGLKRLESEDLPLAAVNGELYTLAAIKASDEETGEGHAAARREVAGEYRKTIGKVVGALETEALMAQRRRDSKREKRKRREELLGAVALLLLYAGVKAFRAMRLRLAVLQGQALGGVDRTPAPPNSREGSISAPEGGQSASGGQQGAPGAIVEQGEEGDGAEAFAESRAKLLEPFASESLDALEEEARGARTQAEMVEQVRRRAREIEDTRGGLVADTETMAAYGVAQWQRLAGAGFETKVWRTMRDDKVRPSHLLCESQGEVHLTKEFHNGLMYPGDPRGGFDEVCNCRCWLEGGRRIPGTGHLKASEPFTESLHPRDAAGKFADKRGMVPIIRVGDQPKEIKRGGKTITRMLGGKWQLQLGGDLPEHFANIAIPPAWKSAHVHLDPKADYHAVGIDEAGRVQKVQSEAMKDKQAALKFARNAELMRKAEKVKMENDRNLESPSEPVRESAACLRLIMETGIRPGGEEETGASVKAYGATTLEGRHVVEQDGKVRLEFIGKKGVSLSIPVEDDYTAKMLLKRKQAAGDKGRVFGINANMLRDYAHTLDGGSFKPKDFRTLRGTMIAVAEIDRVKEKPKDDKAFRKVVMGIAKIVAASLGNTPVIALQSYVNPSVWAKLRPEA